MAKNKQPKRNDRKFGDVVLLKEVIQVTKGKQLAKGKQLTKGRPSLKASDRLSSCWDYGLVRALGGT